MPDYYIGLMSGTSLDGIDAALVDCQAGQVRLIHSHYQAYSAVFRQALAHACTNASIELKTLGTLDAQLGQLFAECCLKLMDQAGLQADAIQAIGCHGHTLHHNPNAQPPYSLQIGDANRIAAQTGVCTVADFRRRDIALGGQGAPLVPAFHRAILHSDEENRVVINIGGIANITVLPKHADNDISGFDTGPGNTLLDGWIQRHSTKLLDGNGAWGRSGRLINGLLTDLLSDDYFRSPAPKSTGREYFSADWLDARLAESGASEQKAADIQHTLCHLTAISIADAIEQLPYPVDRVLVCGGGVHNNFLLHLLTDRLACPLNTTAEFGIAPDWVEAMAFAWLAKQTITGQPGNVPTVTGAARPSVLGAIYPGSEESSD